MKPQPTDWSNPTSSNFGSIPSSTRNMWSGLDIDGQMMGEDASGGIGNNFQDDMQWDQYLRGIMPSYYELLGL